MLRVKEINLSAARKDFDNAPLVSKSSDLMKAFQEETYSELEINTDPNPSQKATLSIKDSTLFELALKEVTRSNECVPKLHSNKNKIKRSMEKMEQDLVIPDVDKIENDLSEKERLIGNDDFQNHRYQNAFYHYTKSICIKPNVAAYCNRGSANEKMGHYEHGIYDFNEALWLDPFNVNALIRRAACHNKLGRQKEALQDLNSALKLYPNNKAAKELVESIKNGAR